MRDSRSRDRRMETGAPGRSRKKEGGEDTIEEYRGSNRLYKLYSLYIVYCIVGSCIILAHSPWIMHALIARL